MAEVNALSCKRVRRYPPRHCPQRGALASEIVLSISPCLLTCSPCAQDAGMLHNPAVGWAVFPFPVTPTELGCSPNENPLSSRCAWADCIEGRVLAFSRASGPVRECGTTY